MKRVYTMRHGQKNIKNTQTYVCFLAQMSLFCHISKSRLYYIYIQTRYWARNQILINDIKYRALCIGTCIPQAFKHKVLQRRQPFQIVLAGVERTGKVLVQATSCRNSHCREIALQRCQSVETDVSAGKALNTTVNVHVLYQTVWRRSFNSRIIIYNLI